MTRPSNGVAEFTLRDGGVGVVVFPPAAPAGPVLTLRRGEPGAATLDRLVRARHAGARHRRLAASRVGSGLNMLVSGGAGSGKTALLAAIARDLDGVARVVSVARHRQFRWAAASKVELVVSPAAPYPALVVAAARLQPALLVLDSIGLADVPALSERLRRANAAPWPRSSPRRWRPGWHGRPISSCASSAGGMACRAGFAGRCERPPSSCTRAVRFTVGRRRRPSHRSCRRGAMARRWRAFFASHCDRPPHTDRRRKPVTTHSYIWY